VFYGDVGPPCYRGRPIWGTSEARLVVPWAHVAEVRAHREPESRTGRNIALAVGVPVTIAGLIALGYSHRDPTNATLIGGLATTGVGLVFDVLGLWPAKDAEDEMLYMRR
jgi:hypothetical protein